MAPKTKRQYPHVPNIQDPHIQQSIRLLWDRAYDLLDSVNSANDTIKSQTDLITSLQSQVTAAMNLAKQATKPIAPVTITSVTPPGTPSTGPGTGQPGPPDGDFTSVVASVKATFVGAGADLTDACVRSDLCVTVARQVDPANGGLVIKFTGPFICSNSFGSFYSSALCWPNGQLVYILTDDGSNTPEWVYGSSDNADRYFRIPDSWVPTP